MTLDELAIKYNTDKSSMGHSYCQYYSLFFDKIRNHELNILEIGIDSGNSIKMWADYFKNSQIHGIDLRGGYEYLEENDRVHTHIVDQSNRQQLLNFGLSMESERANFFDIIIDDGSHNSDDQILTFETLFPFLRYGGYYCCEDLLCDYDGRWNKGVSSIERFKQVFSDVQMGGIIPNSHICANKHDAISKYNGSYLQMNTEWMFTSCGLCIIKKIKND